MLPRPIISDVVEAKSGKIPNLVIFATYENFFISPRWKTGNYCSVIGPPFFTLQWLYLRLCWNSSYQITSVIIVIAMVTTTRLLTMLKITIFYPHLDSRLLTITIAITRLVWTRHRSAVGRQIFQFTHPSLHRLLRRCWCFLVQSLVTLWKLNQEGFQIYLKTICSSESGQMTWKNNSK